MDDQTIRIKELFEEFLPRFGMSHAKVYGALMYGETKTAKQLYGETGISYHKIYSVLKDLEGQGILTSINTSPANFHIKSPEKTFEKLITRKKAEIERMSKDFEKIINGEPDGVYEREYLIRIDSKNRQTRLFDNKNKAVVNEVAEARHVAEELSNYARKLEPHKEYAYAVYR